MTKNRVRTWPKICHTDEQYLLNVTEIHDTDEHQLDAKKICWCGRLGQVPQPLLARSHWLGHRPSLASPIALLLYKKKTSGTDIRRTLDIKLKFVGFIRFVGFNFGQIQLLRFVVVMIWSYSFGHVESVKWFTLDYIRLECIYFHRKTFLLLRNTLAFVNLPILII